jgi:8-oxo-dGTP pyrophosphatase MutT (NUDIX family)
VASFSGSYLGRLRAVVGSRLLLVPGMRVVVENGSGEILLHLRPDYRLWAFPGGVPEEGDSADETIIRETLEETGLKLLEVQPFGFASDPAHEIWTYPNGDRCHYYTLLYCSRRFVGELIGSNDETLDVGWFSPESPPSLMPPMTRTLAAYLRFKETGAFQAI